MSVLAILALNLNVPLNVVGALKTIFRDDHPNASDLDIYRQHIGARFRAVRDNSRKLAEPLSPEDWMLQSMEEASPIKWHLAHTSWFFETFILVPFNKTYKAFHPDFTYLFNSYYQQVGDMHQRARRGLLSRPSAKDVLAYRSFVDEQMTEFLEQLDDQAFQAVSPLLETGIAHEEQHQELMQTDVLHGLYQNTLLPVAYKGAAAPEAGKANTAHEEWVSFEAGLVEVGAEEGGFAFDNEYPRHKYYLNPFELMARPVSNRDYLAFMEDGGYKEPKFWLADGWATVQQQGWSAPLYWRKTDGQHWAHYTLFGEKNLDLDAPVRHVSYFEANAYANWADGWLPTEREWELAAATLPVEGHFLENGTPRDTYPSAEQSKGLQDMYGTVWEWTQSPYTAYPGYKPAAGAIGEYNGKFMSSQMVLRGGSSATPSGHMRPTYRNFFPPDARWQFSGFRLAR